MKKLLIYITVLIMLLFTGCDNVEGIIKEEGIVDYTAFLNDLYENKTSDEELYFSIKDLDNNGVLELVVKKDGANMAVYTINNDIIVEVGNHNFLSGTTRLFFSNNPSYPGIFSYFVSGGLEHYGYITIKDDELMYEELWNEDYSGVSKELGLSRDRIEESSDDKQLIEESRRVYEENNDLPFQKLQPDNFYLYL
jgi:hypothetical protein